MENIIDEVKTILIWDKFIVLENVLGKIIRIQILKIFNVFGFLG